MSAKPLINACLGVAGIVTALVLSAGTASPVTASDDPNASLPASLTLAGVVRDFKALNQTGGHPDFEKVPDGGYGHYVYICADQLDQDGKPVYASKGRKLSVNYRDASGRNICPPRGHLAAKSGDQAGSVASSTGGAVTGGDAFKQWFRDVPGVNMSAPLSVKLVRQTGTNIYSFNDKNDAKYANLGGFFPINGELFGNYSSTGKNFHFTYELNTKFVYKKGSGQVFTFIGDDDVFVFIDGKCVIDIGGVHSAVSQTIDLDRCSWLVDGQEYSLKFFFAERHTTQSNFRIDTTLVLRNVDLPTVSGLYD